MTSQKCPNCNLINFTDAVICKRCQHSLPGLNNSFNSNNFAGESAFPDLMNENKERPSRREITSQGLNKIKWGIILALIGGLITIAFFTMFGRPSRVGLFAIITLLPIAWLLGGIIETLTGVPLFDLIDRWENLPAWQGWLIGLTAFFTSITAIMIIAAVFIVNFF